MNNLSTTPCIRPPVADAENHIVMWMEKFGRQIQATRDVPDCELLFVGDSITEHWPLEDYAPDVWNQYYSHRKVVNAGSGGDCTENILWRLENGIFDHIAPRLVILMAGTNNTGRRMDSPEEIMPDFLHPEAAGYKLWGAAIEGRVKAYLEGSC